LRVAAERVADEPTPDALSRLEHGSLGLGNAFRPCVLGPEAVPVFVDPARRGRARARHAFRPGTRKRATSSPPSRSPSPPPAWTGSRLRTRGAHRARFASLRATKPADLLQHGYRAAEMLVATRRHGRGRRGHLHLNDR